MLEITLPPYVTSDSKGRVVRTSEKVSLEHSLVSLSKWESIWEKPLLDEKEHTPEEAFSYVECMVLGDIPSDFLDRLTQEIVDKVYSYIHAKSTATWFSETPGSKRNSPRKDTITSEIIYYWMISNNIPVEFETWHLNRLMTLIRVISLKNEPAKKLSRAEIASRNRQLNADRMKKFNTSG